MGNSVVDDDLGKACHEGAAQGAPAGPRQQDAPAGSEATANRRQVSLCCMSCENFAQAPVLRHVDACIDALEAAAALVKVGTGRPATAEDNRRVRVLNRQIDQLRTRLDQLALSVVQISHCCRFEAAEEPVTQPVADAPVAAAPRPGLALVSVNPRPPMPSDLRLVLGPAGRPAPALTPTPTQSPRLRCV